MIMTGSGARRRHQPVTVASALRRPRPALRRADGRALARLYAAVRAEGRWLVTPPTAVSPPSEAFFIAR